MKSYYVFDNLTLHGQLVWSLCWAVVEGNLLKGQWHSSVLEKSPIKRLKQHGASRRASSSLKG
jgi:hypothetical protein